MSRHARVLLTLFVIVASGEAVAQHRSSTQLSLSAGSATDITGITSRAASISPSLSLVLSPRVSVALAASGTHFNGGAWSALAGAAAVARHPMGPFAITLDARSSFTETSYDRSYLTADLVPSVEARWRSVNVFIGGHASSATNWISPARQQTPTLPGPLNPPLPHANEHRQASSSWGKAVVYGASLRVPAGDRTALSLGIREERGRVAAAAQVDRIATATLSHGAISLAGSLGSRETDGDRTPTGKASVSLAVTPATSFDIAAGKFGANRLTGATEGRFANAGFSIRLGGGERGLPRPSGVPALERGMTRLSIAARDARSVEIAGDFTKWVPTSTQRSTNGVWFVDLRIPLGRYRYAFRIDGKEWRTPEGAVTADDGFGGRSALLTVEKSVTGRGIR